MKFLSFIILIACSLCVNGQSLKKRMPNNHGITHHTIKENKIQMMKDVNYAIEGIKRYKRNRNLGYGMAAVGTGILYYAASHMDVPIHYSNDYKYDDYKQKRQDRRIVGVVGSIILGTGAYLVIKNRKLLRNAEIRLQSNYGGIKFYF